GLSSTEMPVFFTGVVSCIENSNTSNINHKHGSTKDMTGSITPKANAIYFHSLMEVDNLQNKFSHVK
ncbi:cleavage and polyadenylation specificity factor subunit 3-i, partial [Nicotiana attenuata]